MLESGSVLFHTAKSKESLRPEQGAVFDPLKGTVQVEDVDLKYFTSWRYGTFWFHNTPLDQIATRLERWCDVVFEFSDPALADMPFTGVALRSRELEFMLELLSLTESLKFEIKPGRKILISQ